MGVMILMNYDRFVIFFNPNDVPENLIFNSIEPHTLKSKCNSVGSLTAVTVYGDCENLYNLLFDLTAMCVNYFIKIF